MKILEDIRVTKADNYNYIFEIYRKCVKKGQEVYEWYNPAGYYGSVVGCLNAVKVYLIDKLINEDVYIEEVLAKIEDFQDVYVKCELNAYTKEDN